VKRDPAFGSVRIRVRIRGQDLVVIRPYSHGLGGQTQRIKLESPERQRAGGSEKNQEISDHS